MGITPLSTAISTRGKFVAGNTETGIVKARYIPSSPNVRMKKMTGRECWAIQCRPERAPFGAFTQQLRSGYFSSESSALGFDAAPGFDSSEAPSAGASAASILILVLSGKP